MSFSSSHLIGICVYLLAIVARANIWEATIGDIEAIARWSDAENNIASMKASLMEDHPGQYVQLEVPDATSDIVAKCPITKAGVTEVGEAIDLPSIQVVLNKLPLVPTNFSVPRKDIILTSAARNNPVVLSYVTGGGGQHKDDSYHTINEVCRDLYRAHFRTEKVKCQIQTKTKTNAVKQDIQKLEKERVQFESKQKADLAKFLEQKNQVALEEAKLNADRKEVEVKKVEIHQKETAISTDQAKLNSAMASNEVLRKQLQKNIDQGNVNEKKLKKKNF